MTDPDPLGIVGQLIADKYRIERMVGEGGFAVVYRAEHVVWQRPVAVKLFNGLAQAPVESRDALQRDFIREGALLTELSSQTAGIVQAWDVGTYATPGGQWMPYMVLEWLEGSPLDAVLEQDQAQRMTWTEAEVLGFLARILPILEVAHRRGIAHRDIKPANVFVMGSAARSPSTPVKLLDFGVAKMLHDHAKTSAALAKTGLTVTSFTPQYGAPEQFTRSYGATGPWTDVYALGLVAAEMIVGQPVLEGEDLVQLGFATANPRRRPTPGTFGVPVSAAFEAMLSRALAVHPEERFAGAAEFLQACVAAAEERRGWTSAPVPPGPPASSSPRTSLHAAEHSALPATARPIPARLAPPVPSGGHPAQDAPPQRSSGENVAGILLVILVVAGGATLVFSATDLPGAKDTRDQVLALASAGRRRLGAWTASSADAPLPLAAPASATVPGRASARPARPCPEGMRGLVVGSREPDAVGSGEVSGTARSRRAGEGDGGLRDGGAREARAPAICVDERPVREVAYAACKKCTRPRLAHQPLDASRPPPSEFCLSGRSPTDQTLDCATASQAAVFCATRGARLPTQAELAELLEVTGRPSLAATVPEWTVVAARSKGAGFGAFRCVLEDE